jgi:uncharacterized protein YbjT (DUF2867 family)
VKAELVIGARGAVGSAAVRWLAPHGEVRAASRTPASLDVPADVERVALELDDPGSFPKLLEGCAGLLLIPPSGPGDWQVRVTRQLAAAAARARIERVALISGISAGHDPSSTSRALELACEDAGLRAVILRANHFMQGYATHYRADVRAGRLRIYTGAGRASYVDAADVGRAAAAALLDPKEMGSVHVLTGPEALDQTEIAGILSRVTGRPVHVAVRSHEETRETLRALGLPASTVEVSVERMRELEAGRFEATSDAVARLTGEPATRFEDWARAHAGVWA